MVSYGRAAAIFKWAAANWQEFDGWCCVKGVDPLELPAYRFYNLVIYMLKQDMTTEQSAQFEYTLRLCDSVKHPLHDLKPVVTKTTVEKGLDPVVSEKKHQYVPPWWRGDDANAKVALNTMKGVSSLPKMA